MSCIFFQEDVQHGGHLFLVKKICPPPGTETVNKQTLTKTTMDHRRSLPQSYPIFENITLLNSTLCVSTLCQSRYSFWDFIDNLTTLFLRQVNSRNWNYNRYTRQFYTHLEHGNRRYKYARPYLKGCRSYIGVRSHRGSKIQRDLGYFRVRKGTSTRPSALTKWEERGGGD